MPWFSALVFYLGIFDAAITMLGGTVTAFVILMGWEAQVLWRRILPAGAAIIISNIAAASILFATKQLGGSL